MVVLADNLQKVFKEGIFSNNSLNGFQEGYYPTTEALISLFDRNGFKKTRIRSIRGFGFGREEEILQLAHNNNALYNTVIELLNNTSTDPSIIEICAHAVYIGKK